MRRASYLVYALWLAAGCGGPETGSEEQPARLLPAASPIVVEVAAFGAQGNGVADDTGAVLSAVASALSGAGPGPRRVHFAAGRYLLKPPPGAVDPNVALNLNCKQVSGLELVGDGNTTQLLVDGPPHTLVQFTKCPSAALKNLQIDYARLPFSQGTIRAVNRVDRRLEVEVDAGYAPFTDPWFNLGDPESKAYAVRVATVSEPVEMNIYGPFPIHPLDAAPVPGFPNRYELSIDNSLGSQDRANFDHTNYQVRERLVLAARETLALIRFSNSFHPTLQDLRVSASTGIAVGMGAIEGGALIQRLVVRQKPTRLLSTNAGALNLHNIRGPVVVDDCLFSGHGDDAVAISTPAMRVKAVVANDQFVLTGPEIRANDLLQFYDPTAGALRANPVRTSCVTTNADGDWVVRTERSINGVVADSPQQLGSNPGDGDWVFNVNTAGFASSVTRSHFYGHSDRDIVVHSFGLRIAENVFHNADFHHAIYLDMTPDWTIGPTASGLTIENNSFQGGHALPNTPFTAAIYSKVEKRDGHHGVGTSRVFKDITIRGNTFTGMVRAAIGINSADGVSIEGPNKVIIVDGPRAVAAPALFFDTSRGVRVDGLVAWDFHSDVADACPAAIQLRPGMAAGSGGFTSANLDWRSRVGSPILQDLRGP
ncbi:MAG: glycosyl hydrolase family 28-related protein [Myxococcota bacterium]